MHVQKRTKHISSKMNKIALNCEKLAMNRQDIMKLNNHLILSALNLNSEINFIVEFLKFDFKYEEDVTLKLYFNYLTVK